jgi:hypothetical protein
LDDAVADVGEGCQTTSVVHLAGPGLIAQSLIGRFVPQDLGGWAQESQAPGIGTHEQGEIAEPNPPIDRSFASRGADNAGEAANRSNGYGAEG